MEFILYDPANFEYLNHNMTHIAWDWNRSEYFLINNAWDWCW